MISPLAVILIVSLLDRVTSEIQWKEVGLNDQKSQAQTGIPHSFEKAAIQFKTGSAGDTGKNEQINVDFFDSELSMLGGFSVNFNQGKLTYKLNRCQTEESYEFPENMPTEAEKVWSVLMTTGAQPSFKCQVNGVEVINLLITEDVCGFTNWRYYWGPDQLQISYVSFNSGQNLFLSYHLDSCYGGYYLDTDSICQECPEGGCPGEAGEGDSTNGDDTEPGDNHNYSQAVAHKLSALIVVLLFALNMNI